MKVWTALATVALTATLIGACGDDASTSPTQGSGASGDTASGNSGGDGGTAAGGGSGGGTGGTGGAGNPQECVDMVTAAQDFLDTLENDELMTATAMFGSAEHQAFEFLPPMSAARDGLTMKDMDMQEQDALHVFLQAALSSSGYMKLEAVRQLESVLAMQESGMPTTPNRDPENYFIQFFGTPEVDSDLPWGFRFTGHHLSIHAAVIACSVFSATPAFWGVSPDLAPLQTEVDTALMLWNDFDAAQQTTATIGVNGDAVNDKTGKLDPIVAEGLRAGDMTATQVTLLRQLIGAYLDNMTPLIAADRLAAIEAAGFDDVTFGYAGGDWRVMGPTFIIEFIYAGATHVHSIWRDYDGDYGDDLIAQHMASTNH